MPSDAGKTVRVSIAGMIFCVALVVYLVAYLLVPIHQVSLWRLLLPDQVLAETMGGDFARVNLLDRIPVLLLTGLLLASAWLLGQLPLRWLSAGVTLDRL